MNGGIGYTMNLNDISENHFNCIYKLISPSGKVYVGQAVDLQKRQKRRLKVYNKWINNPQLQAENPRLFKAFKKYGFENFICEILEENLENRRLMNEREIYYVAFFNCVKNGYNIAKGGAIDPINPKTGRGYSYKPSTEFSVHWSDDRSTWNKEFYQKHKKEILEKQRERYYLKGGREKRKESYLKNREKEKEYSTTYYKQHYERALEYKKNYYDKNHEKCLENARTYYDKNRERLMKNARERRKENPEEYALKRAEYIEKNKAKIKGQSLKYREENHDKILENSRGYKARNKSKILERYKIDGARRKWLRECDKEIYHVSSTGFWFRRFFGEGRTHTKYFMKPRGYVNEQGCWLYDK